MIMEANRIESTSRRPRRAIGIVLVQVWKPVKEKSWWCNFSLKTCRLKNQEELIFLLETEGKKKSMSQFQLKILREYFLSHFHTGEGRPVDHIPSITLIHFIHLLIHLFNKHLSAVHCVPDLIISPGYQVQSQPGPCPQETYILVGRQVLNK